METNLFKFMRSAEKNYLFKTLLILFCLSFSFVSCSDDDDPHYLTVNGTSAAEHTFPGVFDNGKSGIDYKQIFKIKSDVQWSLNGKQDWINVSATTGKGDIELSIYPTNENKTSTNRECTLELSGSDVSVSIRIVQLAGKPVCYVKPTNEVALYDRICWEYEATSNVNKFQWILISESERKRMTENEIYRMITKEEELKYVDEYISFVAYDSHDNYIVDNSVYYLITLAYDGDENEGELMYTEIKTPKYMDVDNDAWVNFQNISANYTGFSFEAIKEGYCNTYHLIYGNLPSNEINNPALYAFQINYYKNNGIKHWYAEEWELSIVTDYPNNHTFTHETYLLPFYPLCIAYGWGVFKDGKMSSDLVGFQWDTSLEDSNSPIQRISSNTESAPKNYIIKRSDVREKIRQLNK